MNNSIEQPVTPAENAVLTSDDVKRAPKRKVTIIRLYKPEELEKCKKRIRFSSVSSTATTVPSLSPRSSPTK